MGCSVVFPFTIISFSFLLPYLHNPVLIASIFSKLICSYTLLLGPCLLISFTAKLSKAGFYIHHLQLLVHFLWTPANPQQDLTSQFHRKISFSKVTREWLWSGPMIDYVFIYSAFQYFTQVVFLKHVFSCLLGQYIPLVYLFSRCPHLLKTLY